MTQKPYAIVSDVHCHAWSQFSHVNADGINSRLQIILNELVRVAQVLKAAGGTVIRVAGDLFHVRGSIAPSVFNPTFDTFQKICADMGMDVEIIPGNHDLEGKDANRLGNAMQQLDKIDGCHVVIEPEETDDGQAVMIPWIEDLDELRAVCKQYANPDRDLIIHAPLNGVIKGIPDHGLDPDELAQMGYRRVFVGHYHNRKEFTGGVWSVGATTHQTWSDPGTKAGFMLVYPDRVEEHDTEAPKFVNLDKHTDLGDHVCGNYVRIRYKDAKPEDIERLKGVLTANKVAGYVDHSTKTREVTRGVASPTNVTLEVSVANFVKDHHDSGLLSKKRIATDALDVLREARTVGDE